jgi:hypothetical protein
MACDKKNVAPAISMKTMLPLFLGPGYEYFCLLYPQLDTHTRKYRPVLRLQIDFEIYLTSGMAVSPDLSQVMSRKICVLSLYRCQSPSSLFFRR